MMNDDNHLPVIDTYPIKILSTWCQLETSIPSNLTHSFNSANAIYDPISSTYLEYHELLKTGEKEIWQNSFLNELDCLSQSYNRYKMKGINTLFFIQWSKLPKNKTTYIRICCNFKLYKVETHRSHITVERDQLYCSGDTSAPTADIITTKMHINSTISTDSAHYLTTDIKDSCDNTCYVPTTKYRSL